MYFVSYMVWSDEQGCWDPKNEVVSDHPLHWLARRREGWAGVKIVFWSDISFARGLADLQPLLKDLGKP